MGTGSKPRGYRPEDAMRLASIRWWVLMIERAAIEDYATDPASIDRINSVLETAVNDLFRIAGKRSMGAAIGQACNSSSDCDPGYECIDGSCVPMHGGAALLNAIRKPDPAS